MTLIDGLRAQARGLKRDTYALYLAARHSETPWYAKLLAAAIAAYALSPIDLIPDFIPILGYLDDLIIVPLGIAVAIRLIPAHVLADCRERAQAITDRPTSRAATAAIIVIWILVAVASALLIARALGRT